MDFLFYPLPIHVENYFDIFTETNMSHIRNTVDVDFDDNSEEFCSRGNKTEIGKFSMHITEINLFFIEKNAISIY